MEDSLFSRKSGNRYLHVWAHKEIMIFQREKTRFSSCEVTHDYSASRVISH